MTKRIIGLLLSIWLLKASIEDIIDSVFPNKELRVVLGIIGVIYFGHAIIKKKEVLKWLKL